MPNLGPIKRKDLVYYLKQLGFSGPYSGTKHQLMIKEGLKLRIPNSHKSDIGRNLLSQILKEADIEKMEWENL